jgi:hypothetical protein
VADFVLDRREDIHKLVPENFVVMYDRARLAHLPRYLRAIAAAGPTGGAAIRSRPAQGR